MTAILSAIWGALKSVLSLVFNAIKKYPWILICIVCVLLTAWAVRSYTVSKYEARLVKIQADNAKLIATKELEKKLSTAHYAEVADSTKTAAKLLAQELKDTQTQMQAIASEYEEKLKKAKTLGVIKVVQVQVTEAKNGSTELLVQDGEVACRRLPTELKDNLNELIERANLGLTSEGRP